MASYQEKLNYIQSDTEIIKINSDATIFTLGEIISKSKLEAKNIFNQAKEKESRNNKIYRRQYQ